MTSLRIITKSAILTLLCLIMLNAQSSKENIAVVELKGELSASESAVLTDKVIDVILKSKIYQVFERSQMEEILKEQGFQQSGCTSAECAVEVGRLIGVERIIFGNIGKIGKMFSISLKMVNVQSGKIEKGTTLDFKGSIEDLVTRGIIQAAQDLIKAAPESKEKPVKAEEKSARKSHTKVILASAAAACGIGSGIAAGYFWNRKAELHDQYLDKFIQTEIDTYNEKENIAYTKAGIFTGIAGALIPTSVVLFIIKPKAKTISVKTRIAPECSAVTVTYHF